MKRLIMIIFLLTGICININNSFLTSLRKSKIDFSIIKKRTIYSSPKHSFFYLNKYTIWNTCKIRKKLLKLNLRSLKKTSINNYNTQMDNAKKNIVIEKDAHFVKERLKTYNKLKEKKVNESLTNNERYKKKITIELLDGSIKHGECHITTPYEIATSISKKLAKESIVSKIKYLEKVELELCDVDDVEESDSNKNKNTHNSFLLWDMNAPIIGNCKIEFLDIENEQAKKVFSHSSAHILGYSLEKIFGGYLTIGPPLNEGFYYDIFLGDRVITNEHYKKIEDEFNNLTKQDVEFEKLICTKEEVLEIFKYNPFKIELIKSKIPDNKKTSVYKCGEFIDLCLGPHIKSTGKVKVFKVLKNSSAYWMGNKNNESLQRVYGISFQQKSKLTDYLNFLEEAKKRDHRTLGKKLNFFFFDKDNSPGSCFWLPYDAGIYNKQIDFIKREYRIRKYEEVISPNVYSCDLWKTSGHYQNYKDCMFIFDVENKEWGIKPMNCPGHCIMFKQLNLSYRSLPIRLADFGVLHRNEITGSLSGLTRVRRFQQDDSHIFCAYEHIKKEVLDTLRFIFFVYDLFGFKYELFLSTRPEKFIGKVSTWNYAEQQLKEALDSANIPWKLNDGDGAFYGPKIDILLKDSINRTHQCGTIQLDFQLPARFNLQYRNKEFTVLDENSIKKKLEENAKVEHNPIEERLTNDNDQEELGQTINQENQENQENIEEIQRVLKKGFSRPVIIHRAILGSVERFIAILIEHTAGKLPFWLSTRQAIVLPISDHYNNYANYVCTNLVNHFFDVEVDASLNTLNKKIREAQLKQFNFILVVGEKEVSTKTVTLRDRDDPSNQKVYTIDEIIDKFNKLVRVNSCAFNEVNSFE